MIKYKLTDQAKELTKTGLSFVPKRATPGSNGFDLYACIDKPVVFYTGDIFKIPLGVHIWIGDETVDSLNTKGNAFKLAGLLLPRSSIKGLSLSNTIGLIDEDYQGQLIASYRNYGEDIVRINPGDKVAQLIIIPTYIKELTLVEEFEETTTRGEGGFGSTDTTRPIPFIDENGYVIPPPHIEITNVREFETIYFNANDNHVKSVIITLDGLMNGWIG